MRDPDLVQQAEQAATALEQAWMRWRARHGLGSGPLPPVSSYVGYSVEEPWGQPRVVLGVEAAEAERLAAILDGHDCGGPARADTAALPERREPAELTANPAQALTIPDGQLPVPVKPPRHAAGRPSPLTARQAPAALPRPAPEQAEAATAQLRELAARTAARPPMAQAFPAAQPLPAAQPFPVAQPLPAAQPFPAAPVLPVTGSGRPAESATGQPAAGQPAVLALRPGPDIAAQPEPEATQSRLADRAGAGSEEQPADDTLNPARLLSVARLNRPRRAAASASASASGEAGTGAGVWPAGETQQPATDTAV
jgi:hypothetical protein